MHKKKSIIYILLILSILLLIILIFFSLKTLNQKNKIEKEMSKSTGFDSSSPFSVNRIVYFSSANANVTIGANSSFTVSDLYQYTDIAIFINNNSNGNYNAQNTLKEVKISKISFDLSPTIGTPNLYYKSMNDFANSNIDETQIITDNLDFEISSEDNIDYSKPILYNNCANPITLGYKNSNLKSDYTLSDNLSHISYDGSLLKRCFITLNSIACKLSFTITITNNLDEVYSCPFVLTLPLSTENSTIYNGSLILDSKENYNFIKTKNS